MVLISSREAAAYGPRLDAAPVCGFLAKRELSLSVMAMAPMSPRSARSLAEGRANELAEARLQNPQARATAAAADSRL